MTSSDITGNRRPTGEYPFLVIKDGDAEYSWYEDIPDGWRKAFGPQMIEELNGLLLIASKREGIDWMQKYEIIDIKEKWGYLHWDALAPSCIYDEYNEWKEKYKVLSHNTCIKCGASAGGYTIGWVVPICSRCAQEYGLALPWRKAGVGL